MLYLFFVGIILGLLDAVWCGIAIRRRWPPEGWRFNLAITLLVASTLFIFGGLIGGVMR